MSHSRLLERIKASDDEEARISRSKASTATGGKRSLRGGNSALGLVNSPTSSPVSSTIVRRATVDMGGSMTPAASAMLLSPISRIGTADKMSTSTSNNSKVRTRSPPVPNVGDVGRLLVSVNANELRGLSHAQQQSTSAPLDLPDATAIATLSTGIAIAVQQSSFEELAEHGVWQVSGTNSCHLPLSVIEAIFKAKLHDSYTLRHGIGGGGRVTIQAPTTLADNASANDRLMRFVEVVSKQCQGIYFDLSGVGLGRTALELAVEALIADHHRETLVEKAIKKKAEEDERKRKQQQQAALVVAQNHDRNQNKKTTSTVRLPPGDPVLSGELLTVSSVTNTHNNAIGAGNVDPFAVHFDFPSYAVVDFSRNMAGEEAGEVIARLLSENESIVALSLRSMGLVNNPATCEMLYTLAFRNATLTCLDLSGIAGNPRNSLGGESGMALGEMLKHNQVLTTLRLRDCGLEPQALSHLFINAMTHVALAELDVSGNKVDKHPTCMSLAAMLAFGSCRVEKLVLEGCSISDSALKVIAKGFNQDLHTATDDATQNDVVALQKLHPLYGRRDLSRTMNASFSGGNTPLKALGNTPINGRVGGGSSASSWFSNNSQHVANGCLKALQLGNNAFGCIGLSAFALKIAKLPSLELLDLSDNKLMAQGTDAEGIRLPQTILGLDSLLLTLAETIPTLVELNLTGCDLTQMPSRIKTFLTKALALKRLKLARNPFGDFGARMLGEGLFHRAYVLRSKIIQAARTSDLIHISSSAHNAPSSNAGQQSTATSKSATVTSTKHPEPLPAFAPTATSSIDFHQFPMELIAINECGITQQGMAFFLQHVAEAPRVQITSSGIIVGFRTPTIAPHEGLGAGLTNSTLGSSTRADGAPSALESAPSPAQNLSSSVLIPGANASTSSGSVSLPSLSKSLYTPEVIVPSGFGGLAILSLKIAQPSWTKWNKDLIDLLCHTPCLESTDLGRYTPEELIKGLTEHKRLRIENSVPKYKQQVELVKKEENRLFEARDQIQDEIKRTEKAKENYKTARDRQKAVLTQIKTEIAATTDELAHQEQQLEATDAQITATHHHLKEKEETMLVESQRMQRKIEAVQNMRKDIESQIKAIGVKQRKHKELVTAAEQNLKSGALLLRRSTDHPDSIPTIINNPSQQFHHGSGPSSPSMTSRDRESMSLTKSMSMAASSTPSPLIRSASMLHADQSLSLAQGTGLTAAELQSLAFETELKELAEEIENEKDASAFYKRQLDEINRKIALLSGGDASAKKKKPLKSEGKKGKNVVAEK